MVTHDIPRANRTLEKGEGRPFRGFIVQGKKDDMTNVVRTSIFGLLHEYCRISSTPRPKLSCARTETVSLKSSRDTPSDNCDVPRSAEHAKATAEGG